MFMTLIVLLLTFFLYYLKLTKNFDYWKNRGLTYAKPYPIVGSCLDLYLFKKSPCQMAHQGYNEYPNQKVVGFFRSSQPALLVRDPAILKRIFTTNFASFYTRGLDIHSQEPILRNLLLMDGDQWRLARKCLTPAFSGTKLRAMFPLIEEVAARLKKRADEISASEEIVDVEELMAQYTTDIIGNCGFGLCVDSLNNKTCAFRALGKRIFSFGIREGIIMFLKDNFPQIFKHLKYLPIVEKKLTFLVKNIQEKRNFKSSGRNDFIDIMMECKSKGKITSEGLESTNSDGTPATVSLDVTDEFIAAQAFIFFSAGYETSAFSTSCTLHYLAFHPDYQRKVQRQIDEVLVKYDNRISFDAVKEMTYLECALKESLRILPPAGYISRECAKTYTIPEINVTIDKGVLIMIPVQALHMDPNYFERPEEYLPDRFLSNEKGTNYEYTYLPFGAGPRTCIGERLAILQSMAGLATVLSRCFVEPAPTSHTHPVISHTPNIVQRIKGGLPLVFKRRTT